jgi:hypothetical protein
MIQVTVRQQDLVELAKAQAAAQELALGALATVYHETLIAMDDQRRRQAAIYGWGGG